MWLLCVKKSALGLYWNSIFSWKNQKKLVVIVLRSPKNAQFLTSVLTRWRLWRLSSKFNLHSKRKKTNPPTWGTCTCPIFKPNNSPCWQYLSLISLKPLWKTLYYMSNKIKKITTLLQTENPALVRSRIHIQPKYWESGNLCLLYFCPHRRLLYCI